MERSLNVMTATLHRDLYRLQNPGIGIEEIQQPDPDPLATSRYSCIYWIDHLCNWQSESSGSPADLEDDGIINRFLREKYLYWLEALSLCKCVSNGVVQIAKLETLIQGQKNANQLVELVHDMRRFIMYHGSTIEKYPLQAYMSALIFSPAKSLIGSLFEQRQPCVVKPIIGPNWSMCLQTLEGHSGGVMSIVFAPDGKQLASASQDGTIRLWDTYSGAQLRIIESNNGVVYSVVFAPDGKRLASASGNNTIKLWDADSGALLQTLEYNKNIISSVAFTRDGRQLASGSDDNLIQIWDVGSGALL
ncbi:MAG: hypothetical protein M1821_005043 [Bathelium mastoideum]|nr:MAG: hypothetical protein M1821_005043 [Bathelium mastoideum]